MSLEKWEEKMNKKNWEEMQKYKEFLRSDLCKNLFDML